MEYEWTVGLVLSLFHADSGLHIDSGNYVNGKC